MSGTYRERIEFLEIRLDLLATGVTNVEVKMELVDKSMTKMEPMLEKLLVRKIKWGNTSSSSGESQTSRTKFEEDFNPTCHKDQEDRNHLGPRGDDRRRGRPKLACPTFNGTDPNSWLSRATQYFELHEIEQQEKVHYTAYYMEGEANVWWQWISRYIVKNERWPPERFREGVIGSLWAIRQ